MNVFESLLSTLMYLAAGTPRAPEKKGSKLSMFLSNLLQALPSK